MRKTQPEAVLASSPNQNESDELFAIAISIDGRYFVTGGSLGIVRLWEYSTGRCVSEQKGHSNAIVCVRFSPDGKQIVSTGLDGLFLVWNVFI
jgi:WD40 repeat protein